MAKIDINAIEAYEAMSAEEKLAALEAFEIPEPDYTGFVNIYATVRQSLSQLR